MTTETVANLKDWLVAETGLDPGLLDRSSIDHWIDERQRQLRVASADPGDDRGDIPFDDVGVAPLGALRGAWLAVAVAADVEGVDLQARSGER